MERDGQQILYDRKKSVVQHKSIKVLFIKLNYY